MNGEHPAAKLMTLRPAHSLYVTTLVLLTCLFAIASVSPDEIYDAFYRAYAAPRVRRHFGFKMGRRRMYYRTQPVDVFVITGLESAGVLAKAGARDGDVPVGAYHMSDAAFCRKLSQGRGGAVEIQLIGRDEYEKLLKEGDLDLFDRGHRVVIPRRRRDCPATNH